MEKMIDKIKMFFEKNKWKYSYDSEKKTFYTGINTESIIGNIHIYVVLSDVDYAVYTVLNGYVEKEDMIKVAEYLHRVNYGLNEGNFELDYSDGEIRYKAYVNYEKTDISEEVLYDSILVGPWMVRRYGKGLFKVMLGADTPENCVEEAEKVTDK